MPNSTQQWLDQKPAVGAGGGAGVGWVLNADHFALT